MHLVLHFPPVDCSAVQVHDNDMQCSEIIAELHIVLLCAFPAV